ncbi:MAG: hypothetical protein JNM74_01615 [Myxococcales bacterium]|nr:hypothetical protein [Myxococcales bacterium]
MNAGADRMVLRSWKALFDERRVRVVPRTVGPGVPFEGPGVDVLGDEAAGLFFHLRPIVEWFEGHEAGQVLRSVSFDLDKRRFLATLRPVDGRAGKSVVPCRIDEGSAPELFDLGHLVGPAIARAASIVLLRRPNVTGV